MARARNIKPNIMANESLGELPPLTRLLFIYLWMLADRDGRLEDRPKRIAAMALPFDTGVDVDAILNDLNRTGFIVRYESGGLACIQIANFSKHQSPHVREVSSVLPAVPDDCLASKSESTAKAVPRQFLGDVKASPRSPDSLIPDSLIPDSLNDESGLEPCEPVVQAPKHANRLKKTPLPEGFTISVRVRQWAAQRGYDRLDEHLETFTQKATANGYTYASWDDAFMGAIRDDWAKLRMSGRKLDHFAVLQKIANERPVTVIDEEGTVINDPGHLPY